MKYLKTYESYFEKKLNLKKYILIDHYKNGDELLIVEIQYINYDFLENELSKGIIIKYKTLYKYNQKMKKPIKMNYSETMEYSKFDKKIISQSNNINDCLQEMKMFFDSKKYNL